MELQINNLFIMRHIKILIFVAAHFPTGSCMNRPNYHIYIEKDEVTIEKEGGVIFIAADPFLLGGLVFHSNKPNEYIHVEENGRKFDGQELYLQHDWIEVRKFCDKTGQHYLKIIANRNDTGTMRGCTITIASDAGDVAAGIIIRQN